MTIELPALPTEIREHFDLTMSAGVIIDTQFGMGVLTQKGIVLVEDHHGKVGIVAGGARKVNEVVETPFQIAARELMEETGNDIRHFFALSFQGNIVRTEDQRAKIGFIYRCRDRSFNPYAKPLDPKIAKVVVTNREGVIHLLRNPDLVRKPEFNIEVLLYWLHQITIDSFKFEGGAEWKAREKLIKEGFDRNPNILGVQTLF